MGPDENGYIPDMDPDMFRETEPVHDDTQLDVDYLEHEEFDPDNP